MRDFYQISWNAELENDLHRLLDIAVWEDRHEIGDLTSMALVPKQARGTAVIHARAAGVVAGLPAVPLILKRIDPLLEWQPSVGDGTAVEAGERIGEMSGPAGALLTAERLVLNLVGRLSGIATLTRDYVKAVEGTDTAVYDTRKTTLGWRSLEKYAVRCGGGRNHRTGLFDAVLIKDNHLAFGREMNADDPEGEVKTGYRPAEAVAIARAYLEKLSYEDFPYGAPPLLEIEVDTLEQLAEVLPMRPDIVLLDNMPPEMLRRAVEMRNDAAYAGPVSTEDDAETLPTQLEASGGVNLSTVRAIAETGVERISVGALTHSAVSLDFGLDWSTGG